MQTLLTGWNFMRFLRLGIGLYAVSEAVRTGEMIFLLPGGILLLQVFFNVGCPGGACAPTANTQPLRDVSDEPVHFEELK
jgi:hypothetical protein